MAIVQVSPGNTTITMKSKISLEVTPPQIYEAPGGLHAMKLEVFSIPDYRVMSGWPVGIPEHDVRVGTSAVCTDSEILTNREGPNQIRTNATVRWVAGDYDQGDRRWRPHQQDAYLEWVTTPEFSPALISDYSYRVGSERFVHEALNFDSDSDQHLWLDTTGAFPLSAYTVIMVMSPNSKFGNDTTVAYNGIWGFGLETPSGTPSFTEEADGFYNVTLQGSYLFLETEQTPKTRGPAINPFLIGTAPMMLAMTFKHPQAVLYAATGPSNIQKVGIPTGDVETAPDPHLVLGRTTGDVLHSADLTILDLGLYAGVLSDYQVRSEFALLSQTYGGDS